MNNLETFKSLPNEYLVQRLRRIGFSDVVEIIKDKELDAERFIRLTERETLKWQLTQDQKKRLWNSIENMKHSLSITPNNRGVERSASVSASTDTAKIFRNKLARVLALETGGTNARQNAKFVPSPKPPPRPQMSFQPIRSNDKQPTTTEPKPQNGVSRKKLPPLPLGEHLDLAEDEDDNYLSPKKLEPENVYERVPDHFGNRNSKKHHKNTHNHSFPVSIKPEPITENMEVEEDCDYEVILPSNCPNASRPVPSDKIDDTKGLSTSTWNLSFKKRLKNFNLYKKLNETNSSTEFLHHNHEQSDNNTKGFSLKCLGGNKEKNPVIRQLPRIPSVTPDTKPLRTPFPAPRDDGGLRIDPLGYLELIPGDVYENVLAPVTCDEDQMYENPVNIPPTQCKRVEAVEESNDEEAQIYGNYPRYVDCSSSNLNEFSDCDDDLNIPQTDIKKFPPNGRHLFQSSNTDSPVGKSVTNPSSSSDDDNAANGVVPELRFPYHPSRLPKRQNYEYYHSISERYSREEAEIPQAYEQTEENDESTFDVKDDPFYRNVDRNEAKKLLRDLEDGAFLFRPSTTYFLGFTIKYRKKCYNFGIDRIGNKIRLNPEDCSVSPAFRTLREFVDYFTREPVTFRYRNRDEEVVLKTAVLPDLPSATPRKPNGCN